MKNSLLKILRNCFLSTSLVLGVLAVAGCGVTSHDYAPLEQIKGFSPVRQQEAYKIGIGDELEIKFFFAPELSDRLIVGPDGTISMMFAPHIQAAGLTIEQLREELKLVLESHVKQLDMAIIVRTFGSQHVVVAGEVGKPGVVQLTGMETIMQVLGDAGWITPSAGADRVVLIRRGDDNIEHAYNVDVSKLIDASDMSQNVVVQAGDVVLVPPSGAVEANRWIDQYIRQMMPLNSSAGMSYNINPTLK